MCEVYKISKLQKLFFKNQLSRRHGTSGLILPLKIAMMSKSTLTFSCDHTGNFKHLKYFWSQESRMSYPALKMTHLWPEFNLEGNSVWWVAKSFIMISKIHFLCSHWMSARIWFSKILTHTTVRGLRSVVTHLVQPPRQAPRLILSPFISWLGPTIWMEREFCCRIFAILFSSLLIDIIIGTTWHGDRQLPFLRFRRIKGFSIRVFGEI